MKRTAIALTIVSALLFLAIAGAIFVDLAEANWIPYKPRVPPPLPPSISVLSPENKTYNSNNVTLKFSATVSLQDDVEILDYWDSNVGNWTYRKLQSPQDRAEISRFTYYLDGLENNITISSGLASLNWSTILQGLSEGTHTIKAKAWGRYAATVWVIYWSPYKPPELNLSYKDTSYSAEVSSFQASKITFTIDTTPPNISILELENKTYGTSDVQLNFTVNEPASQIMYSLDGQDKVTIVGNITLTGLSEGEHNVTIYATDVAGNNGAPETLYFSVKVSFPTALVAVASTGSVAVVGIGLFVYFKKRRREAAQT